MVSAKRFRQTLDWRGLLIHMTHYDPVWLKQKETERRYDLSTAHAVIDAMAAAGMNLLVVDVKDAVIYRRLPRIRRRYSVPMQELVEIAGRARALDIEVVPKLNFSLSPQHRHSAWFEPIQADPPSAAFWRRGFAAVDEVIAAIHPRIVHVGMDEDDTRSPEEYRHDLLRLHKELTQRGVRMAIWADVGHRWRAQQRWKEVPAIRALPRDVILMPSSYRQVPEEWIQRLVNWGFEVWGGGGYRVGGDKPRLGADPLENVKDWVRAIRKHGGSGVVVTDWIKCSKKNRALLLETVKKCGPVLAGEAG